MSDARSRLRLAGLAAAGLIGTAAFALAGYLYATAPAPGGGHEPGAGSISRPGIGGPFELIDQHGKPFGLADLKDRAALLFFGYTHCPDVCPTTLAAMKQVKEALGADAARFRAVFVSVDPERDPPSRLGAYVEFFDPDFVGLTGTTDALADMARRYAAGFRLGAPDAAGAYDVEHTAFVYLIDPAGEVAELYPTGAPVDDMVAGVRTALAGG